MGRTKSQSWRPPVYLGVTIGGVIVVLAVCYGIAKLVHPGFSLVGMSREDGRLTLLIAGVLAYGTVVVVTRLLKRVYGREFGTYLDDPDAPEPGLRPSDEKPCARCGTLFAVFPNDFHAAGFCSRACRNAFARRG
jgi:hypothetical protein